MNLFCGFFIDTNPRQPESRIEEVYLQAPNDELYRKYLPVFQESLKSIEWL
jgi:hypothetical protein